MSAIVEIPKLGTVEITEGRLSVTSSLPQFGELVREITRIFEPAGLMTSDHPDNQMAEFIADYLGGRVTQRSPWTYEPDPAKPLMVDISEPVTKSWRGLTYKGGPGSGFRDHAGRPGKVGGSQPRKGAKTPAKSEDKPEISDRSPKKYAMMIRDKLKPKYKFDAEKWGRMSVPDRLSAWANLSKEERDLYANASESVPAAIHEIVKTLGARPQAQGQGHQKALHARVDQASELIHRESSERIKDTLSKFDAILGRLKIEDNLRHAIGMEAADALIAQEHEAMARQLGDHGIHHIGANIETSIHLLESMPGAHSSRAVAAVYIAHIFHDTGYLTAPARMLMDNGHPDWGAEHYDSNVRKLAAAVVGERWARQITTMIADHAGSNLDWENDAVGSAIRLADNLGVYHREKLPPLFRYVRGTRSLLVQLHNKRISLDEARSRMREKVVAMNFAKPQERALLRAVEEVNDRTGFFTLGMLGGYLEGIRWTGSHVKVDIRRNKKVDILHQALDLGQKQASKFIKSFGKDPATFLESGHETIENPKTGRVVLEFEMTGNKEKREHL